MRKSTKLLKRLVALILVVLLGCENFAAVVDDNDGGAFLTKQEFETMKRDFNEVIDRYNSSIDSKIDGAIANYLNGLLTSRKRERSTLNPGRWESVSTRYNSSDYSWRYKYASPRMSWINEKTAYAHGDTAKNKWQTMYMSMPAATYDASKHAIHKLAIQNIDTTNNTAEWYGIAYAANDYIQMSVSEFHENAFTLLWGWTTSQMNLAPFRHSSDMNTCSSYIGAWWYNWGLTSGDATSTGVSYEAVSTINQVVQNWGTIKNRKIILTGDAKKYRNFSRYPNSRNLCFYTTDTSDSSSYEKLWQNLSSPGLAMGNEFKNCFNTSSGVFHAWSYQAGSTTINKAESSFYLGNNYKAPGRTDAFGGSDDPKKACCFPALGFEDSYITNWNQLWTSYFDTVADDDIYADKTKFLKGNDGKYHVGIKNGLPLIKVPNNETKFTLDIDLQKITYNVTTGAETIDYPTTDCYVWISDEPFTGWPNSNEPLDWESPDGKAVKTTETNYTNAIKIPGSSNGKAKVTFDAYTKDKYIWLKWTIDGQYGGGALNIPATIMCEEIR